MPDEAKFKVIRSRTVRKGKQITLTITVVLKDEYTAIELYELMKAGLPLGGVPGVIMKETDGTNAPQR